jgi:hypothetical protein
MGRTIERNDVRDVPSWDHLGPAVGQIFTKMQEYAASLYPPPGTIVELGCGTKTTLMQAMVEAVPGASCYIATDLKESSLAIWAENAEQTGVVTAVGHVRAESERVLTLELESEPGIRAGVARFDLMQPDFSSLGLPGEKLVLYTFFKVLHEIPLEAQENFLKDLARAMGPHDRAIFEIDISGEGEETRVPYNTIALIKDLMAQGTTLEELERALDLQIGTIKVEAAFGKEGLIVSMLADPRRRKMLAKTLITQAQKEGRQKHNFYQVETDTFLQ